MEIPHPNAAKKALDNLRLKSKKSGCFEDQKDLDIINRYILGLERIIKGSPEE